MMDPAGGGNLVMTELNKSRQRIGFVNGVETECRPIACPDDITVANAAFILNLFLSRDGGVSQLWPVPVGDDGLHEAMHIAFQEAVEHGVVSFPLPFNERPGDTPPQIGRSKRASGNLFKRGLFVQNPSGDKHPRTTCGVPAGGQVRRLAGVGHRGRQSARLS